MKNLLNKIKNKSGQGLPLNTIVIAILVITVLLVILVFFTGKIGETGDQLDGQSTAQCSENNPVIASLGYKNADLKKVNLENPGGETCGDDFKPVLGVSNCCVRTK